MSKVEEFGQIVKTGAETALLPFFVAREAGGYARDVGQFAIGQLHDMLEKQPNLVESRIATMPLNEAKIATQQLEIAENRIDFPSDPLTATEVEANRRGRRVQKAMRNAA